MKNVKRQVKYIISQGTDKNYAQKQLPEGDGFTQIPQVEEREDSGLSRLLTDSMKSTISKIEGLEEDISEIN